MDGLNDDTAYFDGYVEATLDPGWSLIIGSLVREMFVVRCCYCFEWTSFF